MPIYWVTGSSGSEVFKKSHHVVLYSGQRGGPHNANNGGDADQGASLSSSPGQWDWVDSDFIYTDVTCAMTMSVWLSETLA